MAANNSSSACEFSYFSTSTPIPKNPSEYSLQAVHLLIGFVGVIGNGLVCVVILKVFKRQNFINSLIISQSAIDFVISLLLIASIISFKAHAQPPKNYVLAAIYCHCWWSRVILFSCWVISTFNLAAIAIERYLATIHPIWYRRKFTRKHAWILAITAWLIAPTMETIGGKQYKVCNGQCAFVSPPKERAILGVLTVLWDFLIPTSIMAFLFIRIAVRLRRPFNSEESQPAATDFEVRENARMSRH